MIATAVTLTAAFTVVQLNPPQLTNPPSKGELSAPPAITAVLRRACYDCHSNETRWPWYSRVAPFSLVVVHDVELGRKEVNFSEWSEYYPRTRQRKLEWLQRAMEQRVMPPWSYTLIHPGARLSEGDRTRLQQWIDRELAGPGIRRSAK